MCSRVVVFLIGALSIYYQALAAEDIYVAELMVVSNDTLDAQTLLADLQMITSLQVNDGTGASHTVTLLTNEVKLTGVCLFVGDDINCNCSVGYTWSNEVCDTFGCCNDSTCTQNVTSITPLCIPKVQVYINGTVILGTGTWTSTEKNKLPATFQTLNVFQYLNITGLRPGNSIADFEVGVSVKFQTTKLQNMVTSLQSNLSAVIWVDTQGIECNHPEFGTGPEGANVTKKCAMGSIILHFDKSGKWNILQDTCISAGISGLFNMLKNVTEKNVQDFVGNLSNAVQEDKKIVYYPATISAITEILNTIANVFTTVTTDLMKSILEMVDAITGNDAKGSWTYLNNNQSNATLQLMNSVEVLSTRLVNVSNFSTNSGMILLKRSEFSNFYWDQLNSSVVINIANTKLINAFITTITFFNFTNVMPARNYAFNTGLFNKNVPDIGNNINAAVVLVKLNAAIQNVTLSYEKLNNSLTGNPQCVFWNFTLFDHLGAWDGTGCKFVSDINNNVTCTCNHLTSFSILMAIDIPTDISQEQRKALDIITYVGVGISLASLVICLIIEGCVWKALTKNTTAFMRHVSIINTALSLLIADICFIIGAAIAKNPLENPGEDYNVPVGPCSAATFFMHLFYLALFFWMLVSGLLLLYRTVMVFSHMSKATMLAISFSLGYGCPLIIAVITVAATAPGKGYIRKTEACWLNWAETMALLALVIPALTIVFINILIVIVVIYKILRRGVGDATQRDERHTLVVITKCLLILTPLFGLTWSLGVGTMVSPTNKGIHTAFAFFNSLQGFFILVFGILLDPKSTSAGSGINLIRRLQRRRDTYHVSQGTNSSSGNI